MQAKTMIIGLTGQTGAGKSTLSGMFASHGIPIINADKVARQTMENSKECLMDLVLEFSTEVIHPDASLNRERLAEICFSDRKKLKRLNEITFPYIIRAIEGKLEKEVDGGARMVLLDAPTLFEAGIDKRCHRVVAIIADPEVRLARIMGRDSMTREAAQRRISAQNNDVFYTSKADYVLNNNEDIDSLQFAFLSLMAKLEQMWEDGSFLAEKTQRDRLQSESSDLSDPSDIPDTSGESAKLIWETSEDMQDDSQKGKQHFGDLDELRGEDSE